MKPFFLYKQNNKWEYSAEYIFETNENTYLVESNIPVNLEDISNNKLKDNSFYVLIIFNKQTSSIIASYGNCSYCHSLYYYEESSSLFLDLSLKHLLENIEIVPTLNKEAASRFINYGFLNDGSCLIENIKCLSPLKKLIWADNHIQIEDDLPIYNIDAQKDYAQALLKTLPENSDVLLSLSGGFDSTFLAYLLRSQNRVIAFTAGNSEDPENEFNTARNTANYLNIKHKIIESEEKWITWLPQMVQLFEGESFDPGAFLCWAVVECIKELNLQENIFVTGDGADQVLNINFYKTQLDLLPETTRHGENFWPKFPRHCLYYLVTKKLEWILHENNISYVVPFLSDEFISCAKNTQTVRKEEYKNFIKQTLPQKLTEPLAKKGGAVRGRYFVPQEYIQKFSQISTTKKYKAWFKNKSLKFRPLLYKIYVVIFNYIFIEKKSIDMPFDALLDTILKEAQE